MPIRFRDLGFMPGVLPVGPHNAITDVPGVRVGHTTLIDGDHIRTGVTVILPHGDNLFLEKVPAAAYTINGFGKAAGLEQIRELGSIETPIALTNTLNVARVADALVTYSMAANPGIGWQLGTVNPVVGECNDGYLNDIRGRYVSEAHVLAAINAATGGPVAEGNVGAGTGVQCYGFKGGIGTASRQIVPRDGETQPTYTLGTLVQTNFGARKDLRILGVPVGEQFVDPGQIDPDGSIMIVVATDAPLTSRQLERVAHRVSFGLGRTGTICHHGSGDFVIAFSTAYRLPHRADTMFADAPRLRDDRLLDRLFRAVVETVEEAVYNALIAAKPLTGYQDHHLPALPHDQLVDLLQRYHP